MSTSPDDPSRRSWQFSLKTLFVVTTVVPVMSAILSTIIEWTPPDERRDFLTLSIAYLMPLLLFFVLVWIAITEPNPRAVWPGAFLGVFLIGGFGGVLGGWIAFIPFGLWGCLLCGGINAVIYGRKSGWVLIIGVVVNYVGLFFLFSH